MSNLVDNVLEEDWRNKLPIATAQINAERHRQSIIGHEMLQIVVNWYDDMGTCISCGDNYTDECPVCELVEEFKNG